MEPYYQAEGITIYHGDCLEVMPSLPSKSIDMVLCDLPYGTTACKWDSILPFNRLWVEYERLLREQDRVSALFGSEPFSSTLRTSNLNGFRYDWIWDKVRPSGFQIAKYVPMKRHEIISVFSESTPRWNPVTVKRDTIVYATAVSKSDSSPLNYLDGEERAYSEKNPQSIIVFPKPAGNQYVHPTQKPVPLLEYLLETYTILEETVLDCCMGSGSTGVACLKKNRKFVGIEISKDFCDIAVGRFKEEMSNFKLDFGIKTKPQSLPLD